MNDSKAMASYIGCLSLLEFNTAQLYGSLSEKTENPFAKSLLLSIAQDSSKHSTLLKGIVKSITNSEVKSKECAKHLGQVWRAVTTYIDEVKTIKVGELFMADLYEKLITLESSLGEEYYIFVQMQTLQRLTKEINQNYKIDLSNVKSVFENIISDENRHIEILVRLKALSEPKEKARDYTPLLKYQNPDQWIDYASKSPEP